MDSHLQNIYNKNEHNLNIWADSINDWLDDERNISNRTTEQLSDSLLSIAKTFGHMLQVFSTYGRFKDSWEEPTFRPHPFGLVVELKSKKTGLTFELGLDWEGLYFQSYLQHGHNLKNMNDQFWENYLELSKYGDFEFKENASGGNWSTDYYHLFRTYKNNLFRLMRNYILFQTYGDDEGGELGWLFMRWDFDTSISDILMNGCQTFKLMYRLNYALWKIDALKLKSQ